MHPRQRHRCRAFLPERTVMTKTMTALAAASIAVAAAAAPSSAEARCWGCAVGAGVVGGLVAGTIIGSAIPAPPPYYYVPGPGCYYTRRPISVPFYGAYRPGPAMFCFPLS